MIAYLSRWRVKSQKNKAKFECGSITNALELVDRLLKIILRARINNLLVAVIKCEKEVCIDTYGEYLQKCSLNKLCYKGKQLMKISINIAGLNNEDREQKGN